MKHKKLIGTTTLLVATLALCAGSVVSCSNNTNLSNVQFSFKQLSQKPVSFYQNAKENTTENALKNWTSQFNELIQKQGFKTIIGNDLNYFAVYLNQAMNYSHWRPVFGLWFNTKYYTWAFTRTFKFTNFQFNFTKNQINTLSYNETIQFNLFPTTLTKLELSDSNLKTTSNLLYLHPWQFIKQKQEINNFVSLTRKVIVTEASITPTLVNVPNNFTNAANQTAYYAYGGWTISSCRSLIFNNATVNFTNKNSKTWTSLEQSFDQEFIDTYAFNTKNTAIGGNSFYNFGNQMQNTYSVSSINSMAWNYTANLNDLINPEVPSVIPINPKKVQIPTPNSTVSNKSIIPHVKVSNTHPTIPLSKKIPEVVPKPKTIPSAVPHTIEPLPTKIPKVKKVPTITPKPAPHVSNPLPIPNNNQPKNAKKQNVDEIVTINTIPYLRAFNLANLHQSLVVLCLNNNNAGTYYGQFSNHKLNSFNESYYAFHFEKQATLTFIIKENFTK